MSQSKQSIFKASTVLLLIVVMLFFVVSCTKKAKTEAEISEEAEQSVVERSQLD